MSWALTVHNWFSKGGVRILLVLKVRFVVVRFPQEGLMLPPEHGKLSSSTTRLYVYTKYFCLGQYAVFVASLKRHIPFVSCLGST